MPRTKTGNVRIIAGRWRRRRLAIPPVPGLRPTPDRVRETIFNWIGGGLVGKSCLDLFAGSGALGFEAASRGAAEVVLVESDLLAVTTLEAGLRTLTGGDDARIVSSRMIKKPIVHRLADADLPCRQQMPTGESKTQDKNTSPPALTVVRADALAYLSGPTRLFDQVFLDPPFGSNLLEGVCQRLEKNGWLAQKAKIYLEAARSSPEPMLPESWRILRSATAGGVRYSLAERSGTMEVQGWNP